MWTASEALTSMLVLLVPSPPCCFFAMPAGITRGYVSWCRPVQPPIMSKACGLPVAQSSGRASSEHNHFCGQRRNDDTIPRLGAALPCVPLPPQMQRMTKAIKIKNVEPPKALRALNMLLVHKTLTPPPIFRTVP
jgi:hypothetical protein